MENDRTVIIRQPSAAASRAFGSPPELAAPYGGNPRTGHAVNNTTVLMFVRGWQGGTLHQIADELGVTPGDILTADDTRMGELMRQAQGKLRYEMIRRYADTRENLHGKIAVGSAAPCKHGLQVLPCLACAIDQGLDAVVRDHSVMPAEVADDLALHVGEGTVGVE